MRLTKIVSGLVALVMTATVMMALTSATSANGAAKTKHDLTAAAKEIGTTNRFKTFGKVPTYAGKKITIQRKVNKGPYTFWKKTKTKAGSGKFSEPIYGGKRGSKICYKIVVPKTPNYKTTKQVVGCISTI